MASSAARRLEVIEAQLVTGLDALTAHLKRLVRAAKADGCAVALGHETRAGAALKKTIGALEQAAKLEAKLRGEKSTPKPPPPRAAPPPPRPAPAPTHREPKRQPKGKQTTVIVRQPAATTPRALSPPPRRLGLPAPSSPPPRSPRPPSAPSPRPPAPARRADPSSCPPDRLECAYSLPGGVCTVSAGLRLPQKGGGIGTERKPARFCVVEIEDLHTSHLPLRGFEPDPAFPEGAQERDYRLTAERAKVEAIAQDYDPALIFNTGPGASDGAPVVSTEGIVLGGNGRTMATRLVYAGRGGVDAQAPRLFLLDHAAEFGLAVEDLERFKHPMLVRTVSVGSSPRELAEWSRRLNVGLGQELDATRLAVSRARFVTEDALGDLAAMEEAETLAAFLTSSRSRSFVRALQRDGVIDGRAAQTYIGPEGLLTERGRDLVADLLVAALVPDADLIIGWGRGPVAALARAAPSLVPLVGTEYDVRAPLKLAIRDRISMARAGFSDLSRFLRQGGLFAGAGAVSESDPRAIVLLRVLDALEGAPVRLTRWARRYRDLAVPGASGQEALFATEQLDPLEALRVSARDAGVDLP